MRAALPITVRRAVASEAEELGRVQVTAWRESYAGIFSPAIIDAHTVEQRADLWRRIITNPDEETAVHVAVEGDALLGFGACGPQSDPEFAGQGYDAEIHTLYVVSAAKRRGVGRALMRSMARDLLDRSMAAASLLALEDNSAAIRFYQTMGGEIIGRRAAPEDAAVFDLALGWRDLNRFDRVTDISIG